MGTTVSVLAEPILQSGGDSDPVLPGIMQGYPLAADEQATLRNWLGFPINRWAFRNIRSLFPTGPVATDGPATVLENGSKLDDAARPFPYDDGTIITAGEYFDRENVDAFIVLHHFKLDWPLRGWRAKLEAEPRFVWGSGRLRQQVPGAHIGWIRPIGQVFGGRTLQSGMEPEIKRGKP